MNRVKELGNANCDVQVLKPFSILVNSCVICHKSHKIFIEDFVATAVFARSVSRLLTDTLYNKILFMAEKVES
jgi:hypothetical protein